MHDQSFANLQYCLNLTNKETSNRLADIERRLAKLEAPPENKAIDNRLDWEAIADEHALKNRLSASERAPLSSHTLRKIYMEYADFQQESMELSGWFKFARAIERIHGIGKID